MRTWDPALAAALADPGVEIHLALAVDARDTVAGVVRPLGWWTGGWEIGLPVDGVTRLFRPVGQALGCEDLEAQIGVRSRRYRVSLVGRDRDLSVATRDLDIAHAAAWLWRVVLDPADRSNQWQVPLLRGWVDEIEARAGTPSEPGGIDLYIATAAEALTWSLADRRYNDATMRRRAPNTLLASSTSITSSGTYPLTAGPAPIDIEAVGGGGGGAGLRKYGPDEWHVPGGSGGATIIALMDGSTVVQTWSAPGGAGGAAYGSPQTGGVSALSPAGNGGASGIGGGQGGFAGGYISVAGIDISGLAAPQLQITIGGGGAGGGNQTYNRGYPGQPGQVVVRGYASSGPPDAFFRWSSIAPEVKRPW